MTAGSRKERGFTLIELLVALVVVGALASILIGLFANPIKEASLSRAATRIIDDLRMIDDAAQKYYTNNLSEADEFSDLYSGANAPLKSKPVPPSSARASSYTDTFEYALADNSSTYTGWGNSSQYDTVVYLEGVSQDVCGKINERLYGSSTIPTSVDTERGIQCWNDGTNYVVVNPIYIH